MTDAELLSAASAELLNSKIRAMNLGSQFEYIENKGTASPAPHQRFNMVTTKTPREPISLRSKDNLSHRSRVTSEVKMSYLPKGPDLKDHRVLEDQFRSARNQSALEIQSERRHFVGVSDSQSKKEYGALKKVASHKEILSLPDISGNSINVHSIPTDNSRRQQMKNKRYQIR